MIFTYCDIIKDNGVTDITISDHLPFFFNGETAKVPNAKINVTRLGILPYLYVFLCGATFSYGSVNLINMHYIS